MDKRRTRNFEAVLDEDAMYAGKNAQTSCNAEYPHTVGKESAQLNLEPKILPPL